MTAPTSPQLKYADTLAPKGYYSGLTDRISTNLVPPIQPYLTLKEGSHVLELASGNGTHIAVYAKEVGSSVASWTPTEADAFMRRECEDNLDQLLQDTPQIRRRVQPTRVLDVTDVQAWHSLRSGPEGSEAVGQWDVVLAHNCIHMIPFPAGAQAIFENLAELVVPNGYFLIYGPFKSDTGYFSDADKDFDEMIRARPQAGALGIGLRSIDALERLAKEHGGWVLEERKSVFRGNWVLVFRNAHTWTANVRAVCRSASNAAPPGLQDT